MEKVEIKNDEKGGRERPVGGCMHCAFFSQTDYVDGMLL